MAKAAKKTASPPAEAKSALLPHYVKMIISGGQTGVDRAALEIARELGIAHGGWCPKGRLAEDGTISKEFLLKETTSKQYWVRTEKNVLESHGTLILYRAKLTRGSALTLKYARRHRKPYLCEQLKAGGEVRLFSKIRTWLCKRQILILNIAGPRESTSPGITAEAKAFLRQLFIRPKHATPGVKKSKAKKAAVKGSS